MAPNAMQIEMAADDLKLEVSDFIANSQTKELHSAMSKPRADKLGLSFPVSKEAEIAYALGVQTAREVLRGSAALLLKGVDPKDVL